MNEGQGIDSARLIAGIARIAEYECQSAELADDRPPWEYGFHLARISLAKKARAMLPPCNDTEKQVQFLLTVAQPVPTTQDSSEEVDGADVARAQVSILARSTLQACGLCKLALITCDDLGYVLAEQNNFCHQRDRFRQKVGE
jgi:hypothetical protein